LGEACLTDRRKVGVLLQAAGLLSLLDRAGWRLAAGWDGARIAADGRLVLGEEGAAPGRSSCPAQEALRELAGSLFPDGAVGGRGEARRAARVLIDEWRQSLAPLPPDEAVARILDVAPFLWDAEHAAARRALAGGLERGNRSAHPWIAGPRSFRVRLLALGRPVAELQDLLAGAGARPLWDREGPGVREGEEGGIERAAALMSRGRFEPALEALAGLGSPAARALAARCHLDLGQLGAARAALRDLEDASLPPRLVAELAEIASRIHANHGKPGRAGFWIRRALDETAGDPRASSQARLAAAGAAWDRNDLAAMDRFLEAARPALDDPDLAWRWHHARALRAMKEEDGGREVVASVARALRLGRRGLTRRQAAGLWNDLGLGRARAGDLRGAERAFLHALRLEAGCDGPRKTTLVLANLAEIRLRQGRLAGVREILARSEEENRRSGNLRGLAYDAGLWARFELTLGRPAAALTLCREALEVLDRQEFREERDLLRLLAARALGWLGRTEEAAAELGAVPAEALRELEPEERPALRALAGDGEGALVEAAEIPFAPLWERLLAGEVSPARDWEALGALEPYRAARLVFDADLLLPGSAPALWRREAIAAFRKIGADAPAERLEARDGGPWAVVALLVREFARSDPPVEISPLPDRDMGDFVGESPALLAALDRIARLAPGDLPVLILGESGTGKELAARRLQSLSRRAGRAFVAVNCAAFSEPLLLSELFGHVRGSFTGADRDRKGVFETAHGGTVFLDEIGDLPLAAQGMLLRVLQEGEIRRLGESEPRRVNVRVLAATHRDLARMVEEGSFRRDLYYRLRVGCVELPALRDRGDDVLRLADHVLSRLQPPARLSRQARSRLLAHGWPGNVRELQNVLLLAAALAKEEPIGLAHLELPPVSDAPEAPYHQQVESLRRRLIADAMAESGGNCAQAARRLGLSPQMVSYLAGKYGIRGKGR
jgi:two-component system NtrC family response regulator